MEAVDHCINLVATMHADVTNGGICSILYPNGECEVLNVPVVPNVGMLTKNVINQCVMVVGHIEDMSFQGGIPMVTLEKGRKAVLLL